MRHIAIAVMLAASAVAAAAQPSQSLGDLARRARAHSEPHRAVRSYTEDDLARLRLLPVNVIGEAVPDDENSTEASTAALREAEAIWRRAFAEARRDVARAESQIARLQREFDSASAKSLLLDWPIVTCGADGSVFAPGHPQGAALNELCRALMTTRKYRDEARSYLINLEDELRRAGGYPGWARE